jgi:glycosyltransferase involved in cell wall biosynthesis
MGTEALGIVRGKSSPRVSVVVVTYNMANFLPEAIGSILRQSFPDFEIIVVDDGSTDDTHNVIRPYLPHVRYLRQERQGVAGARNSALEMARGEYIHFLDADDALCPDSFCSQVELLDQNPHVGLVYGQAQVMDSLGKLYGVRASRPPELGAVLPSRQAFRWLLRVGNAICTSTVMIRKAAFERAGPFQAESVPGEDWDMWMRIAAYYDLAYVPRSLAYYRIHPASLTANLTLESVQASHLHTLNALFSRPDLPYTDLVGLAYAYLDRNLALQAAWLRRPAFARYLLRVLRRRPRLVLERETWACLYQGAKLLVPLPVLEAARRLKRRIFLSRRPSEMPAVGRLSTVAVGESRGDAQAELQIPKE